MWTTDAPLNIAGYHDPTFMEYMENRMQRMMKRE